MPACKLTVDYIWNSFRSSGKRHLVLTGTRGCGKSTLLKQLFPKVLPGLTTWAKPKQAVYLRDNLTSESVQVGVFDGTLPGPGNQMVLMHNSFTSLGTAVLERCMKSESQWVSIDEIGYLEAQCAHYHAVLRKLLETKQVAMVIRKQELPFLNELYNREDVFVIDLDDPFGNIGCVIMASGLGRRFGGNKLVADFHGQPMICRILDATEEIFAQRVVVTRSEEVAAICQERSIRTVLHSLPHRSDTVRLGLEAMSGIERCMFAVSDQPLLRKNTVAALALASKNNPNAIWRTHFEGTQGSPVVFPNWTFDELLALPEGKGGSIIILKHPEHLRTITTQDMYELKDVDTTEALKSLQKR